MESRTARLTILIDPRKKALFEDICARQDLNASQVVRKLMRQYMLDHLAENEVPDWLLPHTGKGEVGKK